MAPPTAAQKKAAEAADDAEGATQSDEATQAQTQASVQGNTPAPPAPEPEADPERDAQVEAVATVLSDLDRDSLVALQSAVTNALQGRGAEPETNGPTLAEVSGTLALNPEGKPSLAAAAKAAGVDASEVADYAVRQAQGADGSFVGPAYLRVVTTSGQKLVSEL